MRSSDFNLLIVVITIIGLAGNFGLACIAAELRRLTNTIRERK